MHFLTIFTDKFDLKCDILKLHSENPKSTHEFTISIASVFQFPFFLYHLVLFIYYITRIHTHEKKLKDKHFFFCTFILLSIKLQIQGDLKLGGKNLRGDSTHQDKQY